MSADYNNKTNPIWLYVVLKEDPPLLGRNNLPALSINNIFVKDNFSTDHLLIHQLVVRNVRKYF